MTRCASPQERAPRLVFLCVALALPAAPAAELDSTNARVAETTYGNLLADALRAAVGADVALINAGAMKHQSVTIAEDAADPLAALLVYPGEEVAVLSLSGEQVRKALERSLAKLPTPSNAFLQVSGIAATISPNAAAGQRVKTVTLVKTGKALDPAAKYRVATTLSLGKGAQGYFTVFGPNALTSSGNKTTVREALEELTARPGWLGNTKLGRLRIVK